MNPPTVPKREASKAGLEAAKIAWEARQRFLEDRSAELKRKISQTSFEEFPEDGSRLKIEDFEVDKAKVRHDVALVQLQYEDDSCDYKTLKKQRVEGTKRIISLGDEQWRESKTLRSLQEKRGLKPPITPDYEGAFNAALLALYKDPNVSHKRSSTQQSNLRRDVIVRYDCTKPGDDLEDPDLWCPISGCWDNGKLRTAAHIVPYSFPRGLADYLFGPGSASRIDTPDNCFLITDRLETAFDKHQFVLVPVDRAESPLRRWKVVITADDCRPAKAYTDRTTGQKVTMGDLDGRELQFRNDERPAARFLYFHFLKTIMICRSRQTTGHERLINLVSGKPFATLGRWLRTSVMLGMAREIDDLDPEFEERLQALNEHPDPRKLSEEEEKEVARLVLKSSLEAEEEKLKEEGEAQ